MVDLLILIVIGVALFVGYQKGVIRQVGSLVALIVAIVVCRIFGDFATDCAASAMGLDIAEGPGHVQSYVAAAVVGNAVLFLIVWWGLSFVTRLIHGVINAVHLGLVNSLLGALFMAFKLMIVCSLLLNLWLVKDPESKVVSDGGPVVGFVADLGPTLMGVVSDNF